MNAATAASGHDGLRARQPLRVAVIPERYGTVLSPCASIRLYAFTEQFPADVRYLVPEELAAFAPHVVLWNRGAVTAPDCLERLREAGQRGARLIYDLDDNLLAMEEHPERDAYAAMIGAVRASIALADSVWCSTEPLCEVISALGAHAQWMPNALDPSLWSAAPTGAAEIPAQGPLRLLYMGTRTHDEDFRMLDAALQSAWSQRPGGFSLALIGVNAQATGARPWLELQSPPAHVGASYPAFVHWFSRLRGLHVGLAPLLESPFSRCKSSIKVLDYAMMGMPTVASDVPAYRDDAVDDRVLVANGVDDWADCIVALVDRRLPMSALRARAQQRIAQGVFDAAVAARWESCTHSRGG